MNLYWTIFLITYIAIKLFNSDILYYLKKIAGKTDPEEEMKTASIAVMIVLYIGYLFVLPYLVIHLFRLLSII